jgi:hypothetical protein
MDNIIWIVLIAIAGFALWYYVWPKADVNKDGKVDSADAVAAVTKVADVNQDGKVNVADASEVITKVRKPRAKKNG